MILPADILDRRVFLLNLLKSHELEVTFTKVNGEVRTMPCTLIENKLPAKNITENKDRKRSDETISVWCTDKNEWRSFKISNVTKIAILSE